MAGVDLARIEAVIRETAATEIMPRFRKLAEGDIEMKGVNDPVTVADKETERLLTERLTQLLPGSLVIGEEAFAKDKAIMAHLGAGQPVWVIDPIDGTRNFVSGKPEFAVMVALVRDRQPVASWIHDPNSGDTIMAEQGGGVWLHGKKLRLAANDPGAQAVGLVGTRVKKLVSDPALMPSPADLPEIEIGSCAGFDYPRLFAGDAIFANAGTTRAAWLLYLHTNAWDHVPGLLLHREGGGYSADWAGQPYDMTKSRSGLLYAANKEAWGKLRNLFEPIILHTLRKVS